MSLLVQSIDHQTVCHERDALAIKFTLSCETKPTEIRCAAFAVNNIHEIPLAFKIQSTQPSAFSVSPQTGTLKSKSKIVVAVAYCGDDDTISNEELSNFKFQLLSWSPHEPTGSKNKVKFQLSFDDVSEQISDQFLTNELEKNVVPIEMKTTNDGLRQRHSQNASAASTATTTTTTTAPSTTANNNTNTTSLPNTKEDPMHGWPPHEKEAALLQKQQLQQPTVVTSASVTRLQNNASTLVSKCTSILLQLSLFACCIYMFIFSYPAMTGTTTDVISIQNAVLPSFLLGIVAEKIRRKLF